MVGGMQQARSIRHGFTLIELSMVLVIIGLIVGGIMAGRELIKAAEIRKDIATIEGLKASVLTFKEKYGGLPGDLLNAQRFFDIPYASSGNGDGFINVLNPNSLGPGAGCREYTVNGSPYADGQGWESGGAMDQLARAGLINMQPFDIFDAGVAGIIGKGILASTASKDTGIALVSCEGVNYIVWGVSYHWAGPTFMQFTAGKPAGGYGIDSKLDDGRPQTGKIKHRAALNSDYWAIGDAWDWMYCQTADGTAYMFSRPDSACPLRIEAGF